MNLRRMSIDPLLLMNRHENNSDNDFMDYNEITNLQNGAIKQMDKLLEQTKIIHKLEDRTDDLYQQNKILIAENKKLKSEIYEKGAMTVELNKKISELTNKITMLSLEKEAAVLKENADDNLSLQYEQGSYKNSEMLENFKLKDQELELLREKLNEQNREINHQRRELFELNHELEESRTLNYQLEQKNDMDIDNRTKSELLEVIRCKIEEKIQWESYSETLVKLILWTNPELLDCRILQNATLATTIVNRNLFTS